MLQGGQKSKGPDSRPLARDGVPTVLVGAVSPERRLPAEVIDVPRVLTVS